MKKYIIPFLLLTTITISKNITDSDFRNIKFVDVSTNTPINELKKIKLPSNIKISNNGSIYMNGIKISGLEKYVITGFTSKSSNISDDTILQTLNYVPKLKGKHVNIVSYTDLKDENIAFVRAKQIATILGNKGVIIDSINYNPLNNLKQQYPIRIEIIPIKLD